MIACVSDVVIGSSEFIYNGFAGRKLYVDGEAHITREGILSLTSGNYNVIGHCFHPVSPFASFVDDNKNGNFLAVPSFSTTFVFSITPNKSIRSGDGMAFVISSTPYLNDGQPGAYLGLNDYRGNQATAFLAIELDTVADPEFLDIDDNHVGIYVNSPVSNKSSSAAYRYIDDDTDNLLNYETLWLSSGNPMQVWVDYDGKTMELDVTLDPVTSMPPSQPLLSYTVNLSSLIALFPSYAYVGFSASTGNKLSRIIRFTDGASARKDRLRHSTTRSCP